MIPCPPCNPAVPDVLRSMHFRESGEPLAQTPPVHSPHSRRALVAGSSADLAKAGGLRIYISR